ncbi:MAG TPA: PAS domain-containing protein, partial [Actinomycetes bacterium]
MSERIGREAGQASGPPLGHVVGELPEGVVVAHASGRIEYANPAALRLWGCHDLSELPVAVQQFEPAFDVRDVDGRPLSYPEWPVARALAGEHFDDRDCLFLGRDGTRRRVRCAGGPVQLPGGDRGGWVSFRDVGREETILRELREERDLVGA